MNRLAVVGLISRRGVVVEWRHATAPDSITTAGNFIDQPGLPVGGPLDGAEVSERVGAFGETFSEPHRLVGYFSKNKRAASSEKYGIVDTGDAAITFAVPFVPNALLGVKPLPIDLLDVYNRGDFFGFDDPDDPAAGIAIDRFYIPNTGQAWNPKFRAEALVDQGITFAYRVTLKAFTG